MTRWYQSTWFEFMALIIIITLLYVQVMNLIIIPLIMHFKDVIYGPIEGISEMIPGEN